MADRLTKKKHPKDSFLDDVQVHERDDRVTYMSINKKNDALLIGSAPPNSKLAATLAQVAAAVQGDNIPEYRNGPDRLVPGFFSRSQIQATPRPDPSQSERDNMLSERYTANDRDGEEDYLVSKRIDSSQEQTFPRNENGLGYVSTSKHKSGGFSTATRHELDHKVAYHTKSPNGELYVSAPKGSNEVQLFDEVARRISKSDKHSSRSRSTEKHSKSKQPGWLLGW